MSNLAKVHNVILWLLLLTATSADCDAGMYCQEQDDETSFVQVNQQLASNRGQAPSPAAQAASPGPPEQKTTDVHLHLPHSKELDHADVHIRGVPDGTKMHIHYKGGPVQPGSKVRVKVRYVSKGKSCAKCASVNAEGKGIDESGKTFVATCQKGLGCGSSPIAFDCINECSLCSCSPGGDEIVAEEQAEAEKKCESTVEYSEIEAKSDAGKAFEAMCNGPCNGKAKFFKFGPDDCAACSCVG